MNAPVVSRPVLRFFRLIVRRYLRRQFHGVRVSGARWFVEADGPLIVYANHGSWWDPMVSILLAAKLMPGRTHYAPMDAAALQRYGILKHVGIFAVEKDSRRGAVQFLRTGEAVLRSGGVLWVTPQGGFADARARPLEFKPGLAALTARAAPCVAIPLAIEYPFWDERSPECLLRFGEPVRIGGRQDAGEVQGRLVEALESTMDELKEMALRRSAEEFETLLQGTAGPGGLYELGQRAKAFMLRRSYRAEHGDGGPGEASPLSPRLPGTGEDRA